MIVMTGKLTVCKVLHVVLVVILHFGMTVLSQVQPPWRLGRSTTSCKHYSCALGNTKWQPPMRCANPPAYPQKAHLLHLYALVQTPTGSRLERDTGQIPTGLRAKGHQNPLAVACPAPHNAYLAKNHCLTHSDSTES